jgi:chromate transporter
MRFDSVLLTIAAQFALLSLFAIGGATTSVTEIHRQAVDVQHWMSDRQFSELFAISQASPGPNVLIVALIGQHAGGLLGGVIAICAMCAPSCTLAYFVLLVFERFKGARWQIALQTGLVPVAIGLVASSAFVVARAADQSAAAIVITLATAGLMYWTRVTPLIAFAAAAVLGFAGLT